MSGIKQDYLVGHLLQFIKKISTVSEFKRVYIERNLSKIIHIIIFAAALIVLLYPPGLVSISVFFIGLFTTIVFYALKILNNKRYHNLAGILTSFGLFFIANFGMYIGRGFRDEALLIFPGIIVLTSLILNRYYFIFFSAISILNAVLVGMLEVNGLFVHPLSIYTTYGEIFIAFFILSGTAAGVYILNNNLLDISQRASTSELHFTSFFNSSPEGIIIMDLDGRINNVNKSLTKIFDIEKDKIIDRHFKDFLQDDDIKKVENIVANVKKGIDQDEPLEVEIVVKNDVTVYISIRGWLVHDANSKPIALGAFIENISERKKLIAEKSSLENQLIHVQKMEAIGTLAGGIAHDFNNILVGILGFTELAIEKTEDEKVRNFLLKSRAAGDRAKNLVQQILRFSRKEQNEFKPLSINSLAEEVIKLLQSSLPASITISTDINLKNDLIQGDGTQIHQVLMNLCTNAFHAMKNKAGTLNLSASNQKITQIKKFLNMQIVPGNYIHIKISDTGTGMSQEVVERIFEPYFTTKKVDEGTGLGLSVTLGIIQNHQGLIEVHSKPGAGTTFNIYLPELKSEKATRQKAPSKTFKGHGEPILILDDEYYFTDVMQGFLKKMNLDPVTFNNSGKALDHIKEHQDEFKLIITDLTMPHMDGLQFIAEVKKVNPDIPVILCTGFSENITEETAEYYGIAKFLHKPVSKVDINAAVNGILG